MKKLLLVLLVFILIHFSFADSSLDDALNTTDMNIVLDEDTYVKMQFDAFEISQSVNITGQGIDRTIIDGCQTQILSIKNVEVHISNLTIMNADFDGFGGAISNNGTLFLTNVKFLNNSASNCGAVDNMGYLEAVSCEFINNSAYIRDAGAISNVGTAKIVNSTFISNLAFRNAGAIKSQGEYLSVEGSKFIANKCIGIDSFGGAFYTWTAKSKIRDCEFYDNYAANFGGAIFSSGGQTGWCELDVSECTFVNNSAVDLGGIYVLRSNFNMTFSKIINTTVSLVHNRGENISNNWWGSNNPSWEEILTDSGIIDEYAVVDLFKTSNQIIVNLFWNNTAEKALIPNMGGTVNGEAFSFENAQYVFDGKENETYVIIVDDEVQSIRLDSLDKTVLTAEDVTMYYHDGTRYSVVLSDINGNPLANQSISIILNNVTYSRQTDEKGQASLGLNLNSGKYRLKAVFNSTEYLPCSIENTILIKSTINASDVVKVFRNATQYYVSLFDFKGDKLTSGQVEININGVFYYRNITDGVARLNLNLAQGSYVITASNPVTGENTANNVTVLPTITENKDVVKYYRNETQYTVKLIGEDGKAVGSGETVKFNINGVFYERKTNESGIAKLNLNLEPGKYIITAEYRDCRVSNNITVLSVLNASDLTKKYGDSNPFVATLVDGTGAPFANEKIEFNINGVFYTRTTDDKGNAKLNINLMPGEYIITSSYNGANIANTVTVKA